MQDIIVFMQQHWALSLALIVVLILLILLEFIRQTRTGNGLSPQQVTRLINHENAVVVDVRSTDAFANGHIIDAISVPVSELEKSKKLEKFKTQPIVLVCASGNESQRAVATLSKNGYKVYFLNGGLRAWREAEMPVVKG